MLQKDKRIQVYLDDTVREKWETFLKNNSGTFNNSAALFRYMVNNIELLTVKNTNLVSKEEGKIKELQREVENLKIENFKLQSELMKQGSKDIISLLEEINYKMDILEVLNSTNLNTFGDIELLPSKDSTIYKKAKIKVDLKDNRQVSSEVKEKQISSEIKKEVLKHSSLFENKISSEKSTGGYFSRGL
ncbi:hypothetical protein ACWO4B_003251 [Clostridium sporogenes]